MTDYVYPQGILPEMKYRDPRKKRSCRTCRNSVVTNPGAYRPGLQCRVMTMLFKKKNIENGMDQVSEFYGSCKFYGKSVKSIKQALKP